LLLCALASVLVSQARAQSSAPLDLTLHVPATQVQRAGALSLAVVFRNGDAQQMLVLRGQPAFGDGGGMQLSVTDAGGLRRVVTLRRRARHWAMPQLPSASRFCRPAMAFRCIDACRLRRCFQRLDAIGLRSATHRLSIHRQRLWRVASMPLPRFRAKLKSR